MSMFRRSSVVTTLAVLAALPVAAQDFDLPPVLPGEDAPAALSSEPQDVEADADALGLVTGTTEPEGDGAGALSLFGENATLELDARVFSNRALDGGSSMAARLQAQYYGTRSFGETSELIFNLRARAEVEQDEDFDFADDFHLDVQELAVSFSVGEQTNIQIGRINIRNGVASGFNPTDWFRDNSLVVTGSAAPADRRRERLGVFALTGTTSLGQTLMQVGYRPAITADDGSLLTDADSFGLGLHRTNPTDAVFAKVTPNIDDNISFTANAVLLDGEPGLGFEVSGTLGEALVLYSEVMAQRRVSLASEALADGSGSAGFRAGVGADAGRSVQVQAVVGANWALPTQIVGNREMSLVFEYHLNPGGLSGSQIEALSAASGSDRAAAGALYALANRRQEPLAEQQIFARFSWTDAIGESDLSLLAFYVPDDGSGLAQVSLDVPFGQSATLNLRGVQTFGSASSIYGANPIERSLQAALTWRY